MRAARMLEIRRTKYETNPKFEEPEFKTRAVGCLRFEHFEFGSWICFGFPILHFGFGFGSAALGQA